jgi:hypothetical protein
MPDTEVQFKPQDVASSKKYKSVAEAQAERKPPRRA